MKNTVLVIILVALSALAGAFFYGYKTYKNPKLVAIKNKIPTEAGKALFVQQSNNLTKNVDPEIIDLDSQLISCSPNVDTLYSDSPSIGGSCLGPDTVLSDKNMKGKFLGGQCCSPMKDTSMYHEHLKIIKEKYSDVPDIPLNPFKTPVELAKKWIDYDRNTTLNQEQQKVYDEALATSEEGPCCCKCWHYYVNEGVAKKMIKEYGYSAKQVAEYWSVSDICGGDMKH